MNRTQQQAALLSGICILIMAFAAFFAYGYCYDTLIDPLNIENTMTNIYNHTIIYYSSVVAWIVIIITDFIVTFTLYYFLKVYHHRLALFTAVFRFIYTIFLALGVTSLVRISYFIAVLEPLEVIELISAPNLFLAFETYWSIGLIAFGIHLLLLGITTLKSLDVPKALGYLLVISGASYIIIDGLKNTIPTLPYLPLFEQALSLPMAIGELVFCVWLLLKGFKPILSPSPLDE